MATALFATARIMSVYDLQVLTILSDPAMRERVAASLPKGTIVHPCDLAADAVALLRALPVSLIITGTHDAEDTCTAPAIRMAHAIHRSIRTAIYWRRHVDKDVCALRVVARAGATDLICWDVDDDPTSVRTLCEECCVGVADEVFRRHVTDIADHRVRGALAWSLEQGSAPSTVAAMAADIGVSTRTLESCFAAAGLPAPGAALALGRIVRASMLLEDPRRSVERVAFLLGFGSAANFSRMLRRRAGLGVRDIRNRATLERMVAGFFGGERRAASGERRAASGERRAASGERRAASETVTHQGGDLNSFR